MPTDDEWNSGEEIPVEIVDNDANRNSRADEDLDLNNPDVALIPALTTGDPFTLGEAGVESNTVARVVYFADGGLTNGTVVAPTDFAVANATIQKFSQRAIVNSTSTTTVDSIAFDIETNAEDLQNTVLSNSTLRGFSLFNMDVRSLGFTGPYDVFLLNSTGDT